LTVSDTSFRFVAAGISRPDSARDVKKKKRKEKKKIFKEKRERERERGSADQLN